MEIVERFKNPRTPFVALLCAISCVFLVLGEHASAQAATAHYVQWTAGDSGAATFDTTRFGKPVASGNTVLVLAHWNDQDVTATITDSAGDKFEALVTPLDAGPTERFQAWYSKNVHGATELTVTIHFSKKTRSFSVIDALEYAGFDRKEPLLGTIFATGNGTAQDSGTLSLNDKSNCLFIGLFGYSKYALPYQAGEGFTEKAYEASTMIEEANCSILKRPAATATSSNPANWAAIGAAFRTTTQ